MNPVAATVATEDKDLAAQQNAQAEQLLLKMKELQEVREKKLWMANRWKERSLYNIYHAHKAQEKQAEEEYESEKQQLEAKIAQQRDERSRKGGRGVDEKRGKGKGLGAGDKNGDGGRMQTRGSSRRRKDNQSGQQRGSGNGTKSRKLQPPHINYTLSDEEIAQDLSVLYGRELSPEELQQLYAEATGPKLETPILMDLSEDMSNPTAPHAVTPTSSSSVTTSSSSNTNSNSNIGPAGAASNTSNTLPTFTSTVSGASSLFA
eukprot:TRINITY_DN2025_c0_g1_i1.p1 TRINITY_DN2025_c0_g1~~TRINITY_DN2025_c0_g1_i1.p1  ORF type:complete len:287 (+),score=82.29 TRINITY_DN2025_c0_g1_i1:76-861(+)